MRRMFDRFLRAGAPSLFFTITVTSLAAATIEVPGDYLTIQSAIDAAEPGDKITVGAGVYRERLRLKPGVTLVSTGGDENGDLGLLRAERTVIDGGGGDGIGVAMADGCVLDGFTVMNVGIFDEPAWQRAFDASGEDQSHSEIGITETVAVMADGVGCRIENNLVRNNGGAGIAVRGAREPGRPETFITVSDNRCERNMGAGIALSGAVHGLVFRNRCSFNYFAGIGHSHGARPMVFNNLCSSNVRAGIGVSGGASPVVRANRCWKNRRAGIGVRTGAETAPVIEGNECYENVMAGIGCDDGARPIVRNNHCHHNGAAGIGCRGGARPLIVGNTSEENAAAGIGVSGGSSAVVVENRCRENRMVAVGVPGGSRAVLVGNQLSRGGGGAPLVAVRGGSAAVLVENVMEGGGVAGLLVDGAVLAQANEFTAAGAEGARGVWVWREGTFSAAGNRFSGFRVPVHAEEGARVTGLDDSDE